MTTTTITTAAELDALPAGSVVLDVDGDEWHRDICGWHTEVVTCGPLTQFLPARLVPGQPAPAVKPIKERIDSGWLVEEVDEHTCGGPVNGMHEPGCGLVPLVDLSTLPGWDVLKAKVKAEALREWIDGWPTTPDDGTFLASVARDGRARADELERGEGR